MEGGVGPSSLSMDIRDWYNTVPRDRQKNPLVTPRGVRKNMAKMDEHNSQEAKYGAIFGETDRKYGQKYGGKYGASRS